MSLDILYARHTVSIPLAYAMFLEVGVIAVSLRGRWFVKRHFFAGLGPDCFRRNSDCHDSCWNVLNDDSPSANGSPFPNSNAFDQGGSGADVDTLFQVITTINGCSRIECAELLYHNVVTDRTVQIDNAVVID